MTLILTDGSAAQASLPAPLQYPSLLAGNEVARIGSEGGGRGSSGRGAPTCSSRGHHGRCFMLQHHFHQRSRRPAGPPKALPPPADGSPPSLQGSPPVPDISHFPSVSTVGKNDQVPINLRFDKVFLKFKVSSFYTYMKCEAFAAYN